MPSKIKINKQTGINPNMDPKLQHIVQNFKEEVGFRPGLVNVSEEGLETTDVVVKLKDPDMPVEGLNIRTKVGQIVTGSVLLLKIEDVKKNANVLSIKAAVPVREQLNALVPEINADRDHMAETPLNGPDGSGVVIGFIDIGCDFKHDNFRNADGSSRILYIWEQMGGSQPNSPAGYGYGRLFTKDEIDNALRTSDPYRTLTYEPKLREKHGTHVMDIAAGNGNAVNAFGAGVAPKADIIFVDADINDIDWESPAVLESSFGDSVKLIEAAKFIFDKATELNKPSVVNISLGTNGGPHDGTSLVEQYLDQLVTQNNNRAIVIAAGNAFNDDIHSSGVVTPGQAAAMEWLIGTNDFTDNELEIWYGDEDKFEVELIDPDGNSLGRVALGENVSGSVDGETVLLVAHRQDDPNNHDNQIGIFISKSYGGGKWLIKLHPVAINNGWYHSWIERDDESPSMFSKNSSKSSHTLGSISTGHHTIVVGSYDPREENRKISDFSSSGPTRDGREKPEISAPGQRIWAAMARSQSVTKMSGTSMASPAVAGSIALMMQSAKKNNHDLNIQNIRNIVINTARKNPPPAAPFDLRYGYGRIDAREASIKSIEKLPEILAESSHPYSRSTDKTWVITEPGANEIKIHFDTIETEAYFDNIYVYDKNDRELAKFDGEHNDVWTPWVNGDTIKIRLQTDGSVQKFGFRVDAKEARA